MRPIHLVREAAAATRLVSGSSEKQTGPSTTLKQRRGNSRQMTEAQAGRTGCGLLSAQSIQAFQSCNRYPPAQTSFSGVFERRRREYFLTKNEDAKKSFWPRVL
ncbi:MAG: hypothetical protein ACLTL8_09510 [Bifidobacterium pseudocatenulatum]